MTLWTGTAISADAEIGLAPAGLWRGTALSVDADVTTVAQINHWDGHQLEPCTIEGAWDKATGRPVPVNVLGWWDAKTQSIQPVYKA